MFIYCNSSHLRQHRVNQSFFCVLPRLVWPTASHSTVLLANLFIIIIIIILIHGLGRLNCSGIDALPSFPGSSTVSFSSSFVVEGIFWESGVVHSLKLIDPVLFVFESHVLYSRDLKFFLYDFASYFIHSCASRNTS